MVTAKLNPLRKQCSKKSEIKSGNKNKVNMFVVAFR